MFSELLLSALISANIFVGVDEVTSDEGNTVDNTHISQLKEDFNTYLPSVPESSETEKQKERLQTLLDDEAQKQADKEAEKLTKQKRQEAVKEWEESIPEIEGDSPQVKFINEIAGDAIQIAHKNGIYPSVMVAQAGLESNWGRSGLAQNYNNLMGTKGAWDGKTIVLATGENINGTDIVVNAGFSVFDSWTESLTHYGKLISEGIEENPEIYSGAWKENTDRYQDATNWLEGRYATDPDYARKLNSTIEDFNLEQLDNFEVLTEEKLDEIQVNIEPKEVELQSPEGMVEVQRRDSLQSIARENEITPEELITWNQLEDGQIEVGEWLAVEEMDNTLTVEAFLENDSTEYLELFTEL